MTEYESATRELFGETLYRDIRTVKLHSIYPQGSQWFERCFEALLSVEYACLQSLIDRIALDHVQGAFVEFGIFQGAWVDRLYMMTEQAGLADREIWGFDSFQGLSAPHPEFDTSFWKEGMYAAPKVQVEENVRASERPRIKLIEGFFRDSLLSQPATALNEASIINPPTPVRRPAASGRAAWRGAVVAAVAAVGRIRAPARARIGACGPARRSAQRRWCRRGAGYESCGWR